MHPDSHHLRQALGVSGHLTDELLMREDTVSLQQPVVFDAETSHFKLKTTEHLSCLELFWLLGTFNSHTSSGGRQYYYMKIHKAQVNITPLIVTVLNKPLFDVDCCRLYTL